MQRLLSPLPRGPRRASTCTDTARDVLGVRLVRDDPGRFVLVRREGLWRIVPSFKATLCLHHASLSLVEFGCRSLTVYLMKILVDTEREFVYNVKKKLCNVALGNGSELKFTAEGSDIEETYEFPNGNMFPPAVRVV